MVILISSQPVIAPSMYVYYVVALLSVILIIILIVVVFLTSKINKVISDSISSKKRYKDLIREKNNIINTLNLALSSANMLSWHYDLNAGYIRVTDSNLKAHLYREQQLSEFTHADDVGKLIRYIYYSLDKKRHGSEKVRVKLYDENYRTYELHSFVKYDSDNRAIAIYGIAIDMSEIISYQNELKNKINLLETINKNMPIGVISLDKCGVIKEINDYYCKLLNIKDKYQIIDKAKFTNYLDPDGFFYNDLMKGKIIRGKMFYEFLPACLKNTKDNSLQHHSKFDVICTATFDEDMNVSGFVLLFISITEAYEYQARIDELQNNIALALDAGDMSAWMYDCQSREFSLIHGESINNGLMTYRQAELITDPEYHRYFDEAIENLKAKVTDKARITTRFKVNGEWVWNSCAMASVPSSDGVVRHITGIRKDITGEIKTRELIDNTLVQLEKSHELAIKNEIHLNTIINNTNSAIAYLDNNFIVQSTNTHIVYNGIFKEHFKKGQKCKPLFNNMLLDCDDCPIQLALKTKIIQQKTIEAYGDRTFDFLAIPILGTNNLIEGIVLKIDDVTETRKIIRELRIAKKRAEESDKLKLAFLANMSHEIRTPLNAIVGFSDLIQHSDNKSDKEKFAKIIKENNEILLQLINNILEISWIESGMLDLSFSEFDASQLLDNLISDYTVRNSHREIKLTYEKNIAEHKMYSDKKRINQIVGNLINNAFKYTVEGEILITIAAHNGGILISVKDTGIGINKEKQHLLFRKFEKLDNFAQGSGLGLSIVKAVVESLKGDISVESEENKGSTFSVWLPDNISAE